MVIRKNAKAESNDTLSVFAVSELSILDGPGKRVTVFFQGCNCGCTWCHSPHSQLNFSPLLYFAQRCIMCKRCHNACSFGVHEFSDHEHILHRELCQKCGSCIAACPQSSVYNEDGALHLPTKSLSVNSLFTQILPYLTVCGAVTLSGGEALLQKNSSAFLKMCKERGFHTAVESSGLLDYKRCTEALSLVDCWLFGIRVLTSVTGKFTTDKLLSSLRYIRKFSDGTVLPRIPVVPGVMDRTEVMLQVLLVLNEIGTNDLWLNPWNRLYSHYYEVSGITKRFPAPCEDDILQSEDTMKTFFAEHGFNVKTKF